MPGTTYTRTGPANDSIGRLADFARFAHEELDTIIMQLRELPASNRATPQTVDAAYGMYGQASRLCEILDGFTTADDE